MTPANAASLATMSPLMRAIHPANRPQMRAYNTLGEARDCINRVEHILSGMPPLSPVAEAALSGIEAFLSGIGCQLLAARTVLDAEMEAKDEDAKREAVRDGIERGMK